MQCIKTKDHMPAILVVRLARNIEMLYMISYTSFLRGNNSLCLLVSEIIFYFSKSETKIVLGDNVFIVQSGWNEEFL